METQKIFTITVPTKNFSNKHSYALDYYKNDSYFVYFYTCSKSNSILIW